MLLPILIALAGIALLGLFCVTKSVPLVDLSLFLTAGTCLGAPLMQIDLGPIPLTITRLLLLGIIVRCGWYALQGRVSIPRPTSVDMCWLLYLGLATTSLFLSDWAFRNRAPVSLWLFFFVLPTVVYAIARTIEIQTKHLQVASWVIMAFGAYLAITAVFETRGISSLVFPRYIMSEAYEEFLGRGRGPLLNPVANGVLQTACLVVAILWWPVVGIRARIGIVGYVMLLLMGVYLTYTRSCWIGCLVACGTTVWLLATWRQRWILMSWGLLVLVAVGLVAVESAKSFKRDRYVTEAQMAESASLRPMLAIVALEMFADRPVFGVGLGQYKKWDDPYLIQGTSQMPLQKVAMYVQHNSLLAALVETGLIGCLALVGFTAACLATALRLWLSTETPYCTRAVGVVLMGLTFAIMINGLFHDVMIIEGMKTWWLAFAALSGNFLQQAVRTRSPSSVESLDAPRRRLGALSGLVQSPPALPTR